MLIANISISRVKQNVIKIWKWYTFAKKLSSKSETKTNMSVKRVCLYKLTLIAVAPVTDSILNLSK